MFCVLSKTQKTGKQHSSEPRPTPLCEEEHSRVQKSRGFRTHSWKFCRNLAYDAAALASCFSKAGSFSLRASIRARSKRAPAADLPDALDPIFPEPARGKEERLLRVYKLMSALFCSSPAPPVESKPPNIRSSWNRNRGRVGHKSVPKNSDLVFDSTGGAGERAVISLSTDCSALLFTSWGRGKRGKGAGTKNAYLFAGSRVFLLRRKKCKIT